MIKVPQALLLALSWSSVAAAQPAPAAPPASTPPLAPGVAPMLAPAPIAAPTGAPAASPPLARAPTLPATAAPARGPAPSPTSASALTPVYVMLRLAPECQGAGDFAARLLGRTRRLRWAAPGEPGIVFEVAAQPFQSGFLGQLQIRELDGRYTQRSVEGKTCAGVINALAFVAAVLVDPEAAQNVEPNPAEMPPLENPPAPRATPPFTFAMGATLGLSSATSPASVQPSFGLRATFAWDLGDVSPWVLLGFDQRFKSTVTSTFNSSPAQTVDTSFGGWTAHFALSPLRWPARGPYLVRPAGLFEVGQIASSATNQQNVTPSAPQNRTWLAAGLGASVEAEIAGSLAAVADMGVVIPIERWQYYYNTASGEDHPFDVPAVGLSARLGLILKFE